MTKTIKVTNCVSGPLSPILSNIVLDELDKELEKRGHAFIRFADDISLYLTSEMAAKRVLESLITFIEERLKLQVNREKTKIVRPSQSTLLGFSFYAVKKEGWKTRISKKSIGRVKAKCNELTGRSNGLSEEARIRGLMLLITGWVNYFRIAEVTKGPLKALDAHVRARLRTCSWKQWKHGKTRLKNLRRLGVQGPEAYHYAHSSKGYAHMARSRLVNLALSNSYYQKNGYIGFYETYQRKTGKQTSLFR